MPGGRFDSIQPEVRSAVRQTLGMMTGIEAKTVPPMPDARSELAGRLSLRDTTKSVHLELRLCGSHALAAAVCNKMIGGDSEEVDDELIQSTLLEILNTIGGRVKDGFEHLGLHLKMGLPERVLNADASSGEAKFSETHYFQWESFEPFSVALSQGFGQWDQGG